MFLKLGRSFHGKKNWMAADYMAGGFFMSLFVHTIKHV